MKKIWILLVLSLMVICSRANAWTPIADPNTITNPLKVLFIGNSHTYVNDLDQVLKRLSVSPNSPVQIQTARIVEGGAKLQTHWDNPNTTKGIKAVPWDLVVLQEQSSLPLTNPRMFLEYALKFNNVIQENKSKTVLFMMWARKDKPEMFEPNRKIFTGLGRQINACVAPAGLAFQRCLKEHPEIPLYDEDGYHPSPQGTYLTACVFYSTLTGKSPVGLSNAGLRQMSLRQTRLLQETAWQTVQAFKKDCEKQPDKKS